MLEVVNCFTSCSSGRSQRELSSPGPATQGTVTALCHRFVTEAYLHQVEQCTPVSIVELASFTSPVLCCNFHHMRCSRRFF